MSEWSKEQTTLTMRVAELQQENRELHSEIARLRQALTKIYWATTAKNAHDLASAALGEQP